MSHEERLHERCGLGSAAEHARPFPFVTTSRKYERDRPFLIRHLALDLTLDVESHRVSGIASLSVERVAHAPSPLKLDAIGFEIESVRSGARALPYIYDGAVIAVDVSEVCAKESNHAEVVVQYRV